MSAQLQEDFRVGKFFLFKVSFSKTDLIWVEIYLASSRSFKNKLIYFYLSICIIGVEYGISGKTEGEHAIRKGPHSIKMSVIQIQKTPEQAQETTGTTTPASKASVS